MPKSCEKCGRWLNKKGHVCSDVNGNWKGGIVESGNGYILERCPHHPFADKRKYVLQHRLVMEKYIKRFLLPDELVHHINEKRNDNRIENLQLMTRGEHNSHHKLK